MNFDWHPLNVNVLKKCSEPHLSNSFCTDSSPATKSFAISIISALADSSFPSHPELSWPSAFNWAYITVEYR